MTLSEQIAHGAGFVASMCSLFQYVPQLWYNYRRRSVEGFSTTGIIIKQIGASFLLINAMLLGEALPVALYGLSNVVAHSLFMVQFASFIVPSRDHWRPEFYLLWLLFPLVPFSLGITFPQSLQVTNMVKPVSQIVSHIPQLVECYRLKSTRGCSLATQHINMACGICGLYMCLVVPPKTAWTYLLYTNSAFQAISIYLMHLYYDVWQRRGKHDSDYTNV